MRCSSGPSRRCSGLKIVELEVRIASALVALLACASSALAADVYYDIEGDTGTTVVDKLTTDGTTNGTLQQNAVITTNSVPYGAQALRFDIATPPPPVTLDQYTNFELPETTDLGTAFTLSGFVNFSNTGRLRFFSNYGGTGSTVGSVILDLDPASATGLRFIVNGESTNNVGALPSWTGYHHVAATYSDGIPGLYVDGVDVGASFEFSGGIQVTSPQNLRFGEDPHHVGGTANEQFNGNVDDILVVNRALSASEISTVFAQGVSAGYTSAGESRAIHYSFEGDSGMTVTDKIVSDGAQDAVAHQMASVDANAANAAFGSQSGLLTPVPTVVLPPALSRVDMGPLGSLGETVTMAAVVNMDSPGQTGGKLARLFGTYQGSGGTAGKLVFDVDPNATNIIGGSPTGLRVILPDGTQARAPNTFTTGEEHLFAFTYDNGALKVYLDGVEVASATGAGGPLDLGTFNLFFGEDLAGAINEQLVGVADDLLILSQALSGSDMMDLYTMGAAAFLASTMQMPDVNMDGFVDIFDVNVVSANWGGAGPAGDANKDGTVDIFDINLISANWSPPPAPGGSAVPEPATWLLLLLGAAAALQARRSVRT